jgi:L-asparaginase
LIIQVIFVGGDNTSMSSNPTDYENPPHILLLGMGGTIAGLASAPNKPMEYVAGQIGVDSLLSQIEAAIPKGLRVVSHQLANINSRNLSEPLLGLLGQTVRASLNDPAVLGLVVTHGTDTIEEAGVFLQLCCGHLANQLGKRVILTGAMLPSNAPGADGPSNLVDAIKWAFMPLGNCPGGIYAVMAGKVCMAMDLAKRHPTDLDAPLQSTPTSSASLINPSWLSGVRALQSSWTEDLPVPEVEWPWVEILTSHAGARSETVNHWAESPVKGLVLAGSGMGGFHDDWLEPLKQAASKGIALVRTSRTGSGSTLPNLPEKDFSGCLASGGLSAPRARIALQLAINAEKQAKLAGKSLTWQDFFARITVLPKIK